MQFAAWSISVVFTLVNSSMLPIPSPVTSIVDVVDVIGGTLQAILQPILQATSNSNSPLQTFRVAAVQTPRGSAPLKFTMGTAAQHGAGIKSSDRFLIPPVLGPPSFVTINSATGVVSLTAPSPNSVMYYNLAVAITNGFHTIVLDFLIRVYPPIPNIPPTVSVDPPSDAFFCGVSNQLTIHFNDANPDSTLTIKLATPFLASAPVPIFPPVTVNAAVNKSTTLTWSRPCTASPVASESIACFIAIDDATTDLQNAGVYPRRTSLPVCVPVIMRQCIAPLFFNYSFAAGSTYSAYPGKTVTLSLYGSIVPPAQSVSIVATSDSMLPPGASLVQAACGSSLRSGCSNRSAIFSWVPPVSSAGTSFFVCFAALSDVFDCSYYQRYSSEACVYISVQYSALFQLAPSPTLVVRPLCSVRIVVDIADANSIYSTSFHLDPAFPLPRTATVSGASCSAPPVKVWNPPLPVINGTSTCSRVQRVIQWAPALSDAGSSLRLAFRTQSTSGEQMLTYLDIFVEKCCMCVQPGQTLASIASSMQVSWLELWAANPHISSPSNLNPDDLLSTGALIPGSEVQTLQNAAAISGRSLSYIMKWNPDLTMHASATPLLNGETVCVLPAS